MKSKLVAVLSVLAASAAFAAPAQAEIAAPDTSWAAPCSPLVQCVKDLIDFQIAADPACEPGEPLDVCAERIIREFDPVTLAFWAIRTGGTLAGQGIVLARDTANAVIAAAWAACDDVISTCDPSDMPLLP